MHEYILRRNAKSDRAPRVAANCCDRFFIKGDHMQRVRKQNRCKGRNKEGKPCGAAATPSGLCFFHGNPNKAAELGRRGGRKKRPIVIENADSLPSLDNAMAVRDTLARIIPAALAGKLDHRVAASVGPLLNLQMRAIDMVNSQQSLDADGRMTLMEKQVDEIKRAQVADGTKNDTPMNGGGAPQARENFESEPAVDSDREEDEP
jgi:hypothetical protein